jgi:hypothetical protein
VINSTKTRILLLTVLLVAVPARRAVALLNLDGTRNQLFVFGNLTFGYNSNIFSSTVSPGDYSTTAEVGVDLKRNAGIIAVNMTAKVDYQHFRTLHDENSLDPSFYIEFVKGTGRTTGSLSVNIYRESRSDSAVNLRTSSWNVPLGLNIRYPINDKFYLTSATGYLARRYVDNLSLANYKEYSEGVDLYYVYTSKLDLFSGYRLRFVQTSLEPDTYDHWFNFGATGVLVGKLYGTVRVGYQVRQVRGGESFGGFDASVALDWKVTRKLSFNGQLTRDYTTIATGLTVDTITASLRADYVFTRKFSTYAGLSFGRNDFLEDLPPHRRDDLYGWDVGARYKFNEHLSLAATYNYLHNYSTISYSDFERNAFSLEIASRF